MLDVPPGQVPVGLERQGDHPRRQGRAGAASRVVPGAPMVYVGGHDGPVGVVAGAEKRGATDMEGLSGRPAQT